MIKIISQTEDDFLTIVLSNHLLDEIKVLHGKNSDEFEDLLQKYESKYKYATDDELFALTQEITDYFNPLKKERKDKLANVLDLLEGSKKYDLHSDEAYSKLVDILSMHYQLETNEDGKVLVRSKTNLNVYMPDGLIELILSESNVDNYLKFWERCLYNPVPYVRQQLFDWMSNNNFVVNQNGLIVGYRNAVKLDLSGVCTCGYSNNVNYHLYYNRKGYFNMDNFIIVGSSSEVIMHPLHYENNNTDLYYKVLDLEVNTRTSLYGVKAVESIYTHKYTTDEDKRKFFMLNDVYSETTVDINPQNECSAGLHVGSVKFGLQLFGNISLACLICPSKVVSVPYSDSNKMRAYEIFPYKEFSKDESLIDYHNSLVENSTVDTNYLPELKECDIHTYSKSDNGVEYVIYEGNMRKTIEEYQVEKERLERLLEEKTLDFRGISSVKRVVVPEYDENEDDEDYWDVNDDEWDVEE